MKEVIKNNCSIKIIYQYNTNDYYAIVSHLTRPITVSSLWINKTYSTVQEALSASLKFLEKNHFWQN